MFHSVASRVARIVLACGVLMGLSACTAQSLHLLPEALRPVSSVTAAPADRVREAWQAARATGAYQFDSDVTQVTLPSAVVSNIGRSSRTDQFHLEGRSNLRTNTLEMQLWPQGGSVLDQSSAVGVKVEDGQTWVRSGTGEWKRDSNFSTESIAPQGDFLAFLGTVRNVTAHPAETQAGLTFVRYTFQIDGLSFAQMVRDQIEAGMRQKGELLNGARVEIPAYYRDMTGHGELWVHVGGASDGLPLRQILTLQFPEQRNQSVQAEIKVNFITFSQRSTPETTGLMGTLTAVRDQLPDLEPTLIVILALLGIVLLFRFHAARRLQFAMSITLVVSMVAGPVLNGIHTGNVLSAQVAQAATQAEQRQAVDVNEALRAIDAKAVFNPQSAPNAAASQSPGNVSNTSAGLFGSVGAPLAQTTIVTDTGLDTDGDTLTDFSETRIGTSETISDTDDDNLPDNLEVKGFVIGSQRFYVDPTNPDTNGDGIADGQECWQTPPALNAAPNAIPGCDLDTDGDGAPDILDTDNDNDGVPDRLDLAPFVSGSATYAEANPLKLTLNNLTPNTPTFVDFQVRPTDDKHLGFAFNVLDWPRDNDGQVQDVDGKTWADLAATEGRTAAANEGFGDMKLIPMLEIRITGATTNLPPQAELTPYNISVNNYTADGNTKAVYIPLNLITDERTGARVAFGGRMRYLPGNAWPSPHEVRLVWAVQMLSDVACDPKAADAAQKNCAVDGYIHNLPQIVQSYYDTFKLTGLNVSENLGAKTALIYEDPAVDTNKKNDDVLTSLAMGLDNAFLGGRDADTNGQRDLNIDEIVRRFDRLGNGGVASDTRWGLDGARNILRVEPHTYPSFDQAAIFTAMTETLAVLNAQFNTSWTADNTIKPTVMFAYEQQSRALGLDGLRASGNYVIQNANNLTVDMQPAGQPKAKSNTIVGLKWAHYCKADNVSAWAQCDSEVYWNEFDARYVNGAPVSGDPVDADIAAGRLFLAHSFDTVLVQGVTSVVQQDATIISGRYSLQTDSSIAGNIRTAFLSATPVVVAVANTIIMARFVNQITIMKQIGITVRRLIAGKVGQFLLPKDFGTNLKSTSRVARGAVAGILLLGTTIILATQGNLAAKIVLKTVIIGLQTVIAVVDPILTVSTWFKALQAAGGGVQALRLTSSVEALGVSKYAGAIGTAIAIAVVWGFFIYSMVSNHVSAFSPEFNKAFAEAIAATIYLIILAVLSATIIGAIIVGIVGVIDAILTAVCELGVDELRTVPGLGGSCFTLGTLAIKAIAYFLYNYDLMIETSRADLVQTGGPQTKLAEPNKGFVEGNPLSLTLPITTHAVQKSPAIANGIYINLFLWLYSKDNLRSSTFKYSLTQPDKEDIKGLSRGSMSSQWQNVGEDHKYIRTPMYGGTANTTPTAVRFDDLKPGINQTATFYLNMGFALPAYECWAIPILFFYPIPVCYVRTFNGNSSSQVNTLKYDVFPATLDSFMTVGAKPDGGRGLSWDARFPSLYDADGDGVVASNRAGIDPNDLAWDSDNDGVSDAYELERRAAGLAYSPTTCDTDNDGLTDLQETQLGTNPGIADTDNDGLRDNEEVWHQVYNMATCQPTPAWAGGWDVTINTTVPFAVHVSSDPTQPDGDGDGIDDKAEWQLANDANPAKRVDKQGVPYHPKVVNVSPIALRLETDRRFVAPGTSFDYTTTLVADVAMAPSVLDISVPPSINTPPPATVGFDPQTFIDTQVVTQTTRLTLNAGTNLQQLGLTSSVRARLAPLGPVTFTIGSTTLQQVDDLAGSPYAKSDAAVASVMGSEDSYVLSALTSDAAYQSRGGNGDIRNYSLPNGTKFILDNGTSPAAKRGGMEPSSACNTYGVCMVVWDELRTSGAITDAIKGALIRSDGQFLQSVPLMNLTRTKSHFFRPVVATDGKNFTVVSEMADDAGSPTTWISLETFNHDGSFRNAFLSGFETSPSSRAPASTDRSLAFALTWFGDRYRLAIQVRPFSGRSNGNYLYATDYRPSINTGTGYVGLTLATISTAAFGVADEPPAMAYDPLNNLTLLVWSTSGNGVRTTLFPNFDSSNFVSGPSLGSGNQLSVAYHPTAKAWLVGVNGYYDLWKPDMSSRLPVTLGQNGGFVNAGSTLACPTAASQPLVDLRFEEMPGATTYVDSSINGNNAQCYAPGFCPTTGIAGAVDAGGIAVGTPASDYGIFFDGENDSLTGPTGIDPTQENLSIAFWYKSVRSPGGSNFPIFVFPAALSMYNGGIGLLVNGTVADTTVNVVDGKWHHIVTTHNVATNAFAIYVDGVSQPLLIANTTTNYGLSGLSIGGQTNAPSSLDEFKVYRAVLTPSQVQALYSRSQQSYCVTTSAFGQYVSWNKLFVTASDPRGGKITTSNSMTITVDADVPTSTIAGLVNGQYLAGNKTHTIGGNASDPTSGVSKVELSVNGAAYQPVNGSATWAYNLTANEGTYWLQTRATDVAGNVEVPATGIIITADATPPQVILDAVPVAPFLPTKNAAGQWEITLSGSAVDAPIGALPGSGVRQDSVEVRLQGRDSDSLGNGWQPATLIGNAWTIHYTFADGQLDPTGSYSVSVRAIDTIGNATSDVAATASLALDVIGPSAALSEADANRAVFSDTVTLSGVISDTGLAGIDQLQIAFTPVGRIAALPNDISSDQADALLNRVWLTPTLAQRGAGITQTTWQIQIPAGLEDMIQIDLRGTDMLGNRLMSSNAWRGVIDTLAPRVIITSTPTGASYFDMAAGIRRYQYQYTCTALDRYLSNANFNCLSNSFRPPTRVFDSDPAVQALFPDLTIRSGLANTFTVWLGTNAPGATASACDDYGHCTTKHLANPAQQALMKAQSADAAIALSLPYAVVVAPDDLGYVASKTGALSVTVAAEAAQALKSIVITLDGQVAATLDYALAEAVTQTQRTIALTPAGQGAHTLVAQATDWSNRVQVTPIPVDFVLDTSAPTATLDPTPLTISDTYQSGSGVLRFRGTASDTVGLATVQVKINDGAFNDAIFGNGEWQTALYFPNPEGKTLSVTVRAMDYAGQVTQFSQSLGTNLSSADAPDTFISATPSNPSATTAATFAFTGASAVRDVAAFECQIDSGAFVSCVSPWPMSDLSNGPHVFQVRTRDSLGNVDLSPARYAWTIDVATLKTTIVAGPSNPSDQREAGFTFNGVSGVTRFECSLDDGPFTPCTSPAQVTGLTDGDHTFRVRGLDAANRVGASARYAWRVVNAAPLANSQTLTTSINTALAITLNAVDEDALTYQLGTPAHGVVLGVPPNMNYVPDTGFTGADQFTFQVNDGQAGSNVARISISVVPTETIPTTPITPTPPISMHWFIPIVLQ